MIASIPQDTTVTQLQETNKTLVYDKPVGLLKQIITKDDLQLQPNPAYGLSHRVVIDANPAYESCK